MTRTTARPRRGFPRCRNALTGIALGAILAAAFAAPAAADSCTAQQRADEAVLITLITTSGLPAFGSGFVWDGAGRIVTNYHVASAGYSPWITYRDGSQVPARVMAASANDDLAVLQPIRDDGHGRNPANPVIFGRVEAGEQVVAYGNPGGRGLTRTGGRVRGTGRVINSAGTVLSGMIETSVPLVPGNSGGPLFDCGGGFLGINAAAVLTAGGSEAGFTIPASHVSRVVTALIGEQTRNVAVAAAQDPHRDGVGRRHGSGVPAAAASAPPVYQVSAPPPAPPPRLGVLVAAGAEGLTVLGVTPGTAGARAGLQVGDILRAVDKRPLLQPQDVTAALQMVAAASGQARVEVARGGRLLAVTVQLSDG